VPIAAGALLVDIMVFAMGDTPLIESNNALHDSRPWLLMTTLE
jgi:hypothetical protein